MKYTILYSILATVVFGAIVDETDHYKKSGLAFSSESLRRHHDNQDRFMVASFKKANHNLKIYAVFDGKIYNHLKDQFAATIEASFPAIGSSGGSGDLSSEDIAAIEKHLVDVSLQIDRVICERNSAIFTSRGDGASAVAILTVDEKHFFTYNLGTGQALVYAGEDEVLASDPHSPLSDLENLRIDHLTQPGQRPYDFFALGQTRGFGYCHYKSAHGRSYTGTGMFSAVPDVKHYKGHPRDNVRIFLGSERVFSLQQFDWNREDENQFYVEPYLTNDKGEEYRNPDYYEHSAPFSRPKWKAVADVNLAQMLNENNPAKFACGSPNPVHGSPFTSTLITDTVQVPDYS